MESGSGSGEERSRLGAAAGSHEGQQREAAGIQAEEDYEIPLSDAFQISVVHDKVDDWLEELRINAEAVPSGVLVRLTTLRQKRQENDVRDVYVAGGFFDMTGMLIELLFQCEEVDYHGQLYEGTAEASGIVVGIKERVKQIEAETGTQVGILGGRFKVVT